MKKILILLLMIFQFNRIISQEVPPDWNSMMYEDNANYFNITNVVDNYFANSTNTESNFDEGQRNSFENYTRWKNYWSSRVGDGTTQNIGSFKMANRRAGLYLCLHKYYFSSRSYESH